MLAASYLENYLALFMQYSMVDDLDKNEWFDGFGPFSTYEQRAVAAYAFKLIPKSTKRDFQLIGKIRNYFAHKPIDANFDTPPVSDWVNELNCPVVSTAELPTSRRHKFLFTISLAVSGMHNAMHKHKTRKGHDATPLKT